MPPPTTRAAAGALLCAAGLHLAAAVRLPRVPVDLIHDRSARALSDADFRAAIASSHARGETAPPDWECSWRPLAYAYAVALQPWRPASAFADIHDALELTTLCNVTFVPPPGADAAAAARRLAPLPAAGTTLYVDPVGGNDNNDGSEGAPLAHVAVAVAKMDGAPRPSLVVLRAGVHRLSETITLGASDSGLSFAAYPGEAPVVTGGTVITPVWVPYNVSAGGSWVTATGSNNMYGQVRRGEGGE